MEIKYEINTWFKIKMKYNVNIQKGLINRNLNLFYYN